MAARNEPRPQNCVSRFGDGIRFASDQLRLCCCTNSTRQMCLLKSSEEGSDEAIFDWPGAHRAWRAADETRQQHCAASPAYVLACTDGGSADCRRFRRGAYATVQQEI